MKRRNFVQSLLVIPAASVAAEQAPQPAPQPAPPPATPPPAHTPPLERRGPKAIKLATVEPDAGAETVTAFFTPAQFSALTRLAAVLVPPIKTNPGALDAHAPEFIDFLISCSAAPDQKLYRDGLDGLNATAKKHFHKIFADLDTKEADSIIRPLLVPRPWDREVPKDPMQHFMAQVHDDLRTATTNTAEWAAAGALTGRARFNGGRRFYWKPIDPRVGA